MKQGPLLFIFTCVYNGEKFISKLFTSLLAQKSNNFIHYVYNDGSTDKIDEIVLKYLKLAKQNNIEVIYEKSNVNRGSKFSTQHCLDISKKFKSCKYVCWINCDDWVESNFVSSFENYLISNPKIDLLILNTGLFKKNGNNYELIGDTLNHSDYYSLKKYAFQKFIEGDFPFGYFIFSKDYYFKTNSKNYLTLNPLSKTYYNDVEIYFILLGNNPQLEISKEITVNFYDRSDSITNSIGFFDLNDDLCKKSLAITQKYVTHSLYNDFLDVINTLQVIQKISVVYINFTRKQLRNNLKLYNKYVKNELFDKIEFKKKIKIYLFIFLPRFIIRIVKMIKRLFRYVFVKK